MPGDLNLLIPNTTLSYRSSTQRSFLIQGLLRNCSVLGASKIKNTAYNGKPPVWSVPTLRISAPCKDVWHMLMTFLLSCWSVLTGPRVASWAVATARNHSLWCWVDSIKAAVDLNGGGAFRLPPEPGSCLSHPNEWSHCPHNCPQKAKGPDRPPGRNSGSLKVHSLLQPVGSRIQPLSHFQTLSSGVQQLRDCLHVCKMGMIIPLSSYNVIMKQSDSWRHSAWPSSPVNINCEQTQEQHTAENEDIRG